jgi:hypothetical protein
LDPGSYRFELEFAAAQLDAEMLAQRMSVVDLEPMIYRSVPHPQSQRGCSHRPGWRLTEAQILDAIDKAATMTNRPEIARFALLRAILSGFVKAYGHNGYFTSLKAPIESMTLGTGWRPARRALRRDNGAALRIGWAACGARHYMS